MTHNAVMYRHTEARAIGRAAAFTVLELMVAMSIAGILLVVAVPTLRHFTLKQRMTAAVSGLHYDLLMARNEAVFRRGSVVACPGNAAEGCAAHADWEKGWIVFSDRNGDHQLQPSETLLGQGNPLEGIRARGSARRDRIRFSADGSAPGSNTSIRFCGGAGPVDARKLVISNLGRIRRDREPDIDPSLCPGA
jgi:type IV fimbrial biogenesis protein FimT